MIFVVARIDHNTQPPLCAVPYRQDIACKNTRPYCQCTICHCRCNNTDAGKFHNIFLSCYYYGFFSLFLSSMDSVTELCFTDKCNFPSLFPASPSFYYAHTHFRQVMWEKMWNQYYIGFLRYVL